METTLISGYREAFDSLEARSEYVCFEFAGNSLGFYSEDPDVIPWLTHYFAGYFAPSNNKSPDAVIYTSGDTALFDQLYAGVSAARDPGADEYADVELALDGEHILTFDGFVNKHSPPEKICYLLDLPKRRILTAFTGATKVRQLIALRIVRDLMNLLMYDKGWVPLHATACIRNSAGVSIIGGKFAGKTSMLFNLLDQPGTKLVTNDRLFLRDGGTYLEGCGFPRQAGLRVGTLLATPKLQEWLEHASDTFYQQISAEQLHEIAAATPPAELKNRPEKIVLIPSEVAASFGVAIEPVTPIDLFVAVSYAPELEEAHFAPMEKEEFVSHATSLGSELAKRHRYLRKFVSYDDDVLRERLAALLAKYYPTVLVRELAQNEHTNSQSVALIDACISER